MSFYQQWSSHPHGQTKETLLALLREHYLFLERKYDCERIELEDGYSYRNSTTIVYVRNWVEPWVGLDSLDHPVEKECFGIPISFVIRAKRSKFLYTPDGPMEDKFGLYAKALPECCDEILQGNFDIFTDLVRDIKQHHKDREEWETNLYLNSDLASADRAFKAKEYAKCIELLSPIQDHLSPAFKKKLTYAQKHT